MMEITKRIQKRWVQFACLFLAVLTVPCFAQVSLPVGNTGTTSFTDGHAGPGWALEQYIDYEYAPHMKDANGKNVAGTNTVTASVFVEHIAYTADFKIPVVNAYYGVEALNPIMDLTVQTAHGGINRNRGIGDLTFSPLMLVWKPVKIGGMLYAHRLTPVEFAVPTGKYSALNSVNPSNHVVNYNPWYALTLYPVKNSRKFEISARLHYLWNGKNNKPFIGFGFKNDQPGQAFHENYAASYAITKHIRVGYNGYAVTQFTDNKINGVAQSDSQERLYGNGFGFKVFGKGVEGWLNAYWESGAKNTSEAQKVNFRITKILAEKEMKPGPSPK